jgi:MoaA/NifB/PqqE/SkfB family radical SAM enzyme/Tfp pilus assembly protein PilF
MLSAELTRRYDRARDLAGKPFRAGCYAPFVSLYFNTVGDVVACCKNQSFVLGNVGRESLHSIWNGARIGQLRDALARYDFGAGCGQCEWQLRSGDFKGVYAHVFERLPLASRVPEWPAMMEFTISNTCNFECTMCSGELSSSIRGHREGLPPLPKAYGERFFAELRAFLPHLKQANFLGGEPFLAAENFRIFELMAQLGLTIPCHVTTNGSIWNADVERILARFPVAIAISLDGATKATFESIRVNGDFDVVMANARRFHAACRRNRTGFGFAFCLMRENWHEAAGIQRIADELDASLFINTVVDPAGSSLYSLPPAELLEIVGKIERSLAPRPADLLRPGRLLRRRHRRNRALWRGVLAGLRAHAEQDLRGELRSVRDDALDALRSSQEAPGRFVDRAWELIAAGRFREAGEAAAQTPATSPLHWQSLVVAAHALRRSGDLAAAEQKLADAQRLSARRAELFIERAWLRLDQERFDDGLAEVERALALAPAGGEAGSNALRVRANLLACKGDADAAIRLFDRLLESSPDDPLLHSQRGFALAGAGRRDEALAAAERALALAPAFAEAMRLRDSLATKSDAP